MQHWNSMISSYRLIITKSYPKVSYLWVTFSFFTAQQLDSIRTTAVVRFKVLTIPKTGIISSGNYSYIFRLLLLYFPAATPISFNHISYIFQSHLLYLSMIIDTSNYRPFWWYLWHQWHLWHLFSKTFFTRAGRKNFSERLPARLRERVFKKTLSPVSSVIPK